MKMLRTLTEITATAILLGTTSCSFQDDHDEPNTTLAPNLCGTDISTTPIKTMFPGPYEQAFQVFSHQDSLKTLEKGRKHGHCIVELDYKDRYGLENHIGVNIDARVSNDATAKQLLTGAEKFGLPVRETLQSGDISGISGSKGSAVAFPCTERTDQARSVEVTVDFTPDEINITEKRKKLITTTSSTYAIQISRYLNDKFLRCLAPGNMSGPIKTYSREGT